MMGKDKQKKTLFFLGIFIIAWTILTLWLNIEHKKELDIISQANDLSLKVTHTSDVIISSHVTDYPEIHKNAMSKYKSQISDLRASKEDLESLWPKTPTSLVKAIEEAEMTYADLLENQNSYSLHEKFSNANVYFKNMAYHEYSLARRDMLHMNLPLFLILALLLLLILRSAESVHFSWTLSKSTQKARHSFTQL